MTKNSLFLLGLYFLAGAIEGKEVTYIYLVH